MSHSTSPEYLKLCHQIPTELNKRLFLASFEGSIDQVIEALQLGANPNYFHHPEDQKNSLHVASELGHLSIVQLLLQAGADSNSIAATSQATALILASQNGHLEVVSTLLDHGANLTLENGYGSTALHVASREGFSNIVSLLLSRGADPNVLNKKGNSPLHFVCYSEAHREEGQKIVKDLVASGANLEARDHHGNTPLLACCISGRSDLLTLLLSLGSDSTAKDDEGRDAMVLSSFFHPSPSQTLDSLVAALRPSHHNPHSFESLHSSLHNSLK